MVYLYTSWYISIHGVSISLYTMLYIYMLVGGFNHLDKYESQWAGSSHLLWKIKKNVPNHQPVCLYHGISLYIMVYLYTSWYISIHGVSISLYTMLYIYIYMLVGGFNHLDKYESQWAGSSHILWKIKKMFQTTNQYVYIMVYLHTSWYISIHHGISLYMVYLYLYTPCYIYICWLVVLTILTNMKVNGQDHPIYYGKLKKCSKPPTSMSISWYISIHHGISLYIMVYLYTWCIYISIHHVIYIYMLVGGFNHLDKYESQWAGSSHILWKIKNMFQTTNQYVYIMVYLYTLWYISIHGVSISLYTMLYIYMLVGGFNHLDKYESQWAGSSHILWKIKKMFQTTNQYVYIMVYLYTSWYISIHHGISLYMVYLYLYTPCYIYICWLVVLTILTNMKVNGQDHPIYYGKLKNVPNHQPVCIYHGISLYIMVYLYTWCIYISIHHVIYIYMLVGGFNHLDKYESQWAGSSHILWKIKKMFQTTNQYVYIMVYLYILGCLPMDIMIVMDSSNIYIYDNPAVDGIYQIQWIIMGLPSSKLT